MNRFDSAFQIYAKRYRIMIVKTYSWNRWMRSTYYRHITDWLKWAMVRNSCRKRPFGWVCPWFGLDLWPDLVCGAPGFLLRFRVLYCVALIHLWHPDERSRSLGSDWEFSIRNRERCAIDVKCCMVECPLRPFQLFSIAMDLAMVCHWWTYRQVGSLFLDLIVVLFCCCFCCYKAIQMKWKWKKETINKGHFRLHLTYAITMFRTTSIHIHTHT